MGLKIASLIGKAAGVAVSVRVQGRGQCISVGITRPDQEFTDAEQRVIRQMGAVRGASFVRGIEIDVDNGINPFGCEFYWGV